MGNEEGRAAATGCCSSRTQSVGVGVWGCRTSGIRDATETSLVKPPPNNNHRYANRPKAKMSLSAAVKTHIAFGKNARE